MTTTTTPGPAPVAPARAPRRPLSRTASTRWIRGITYVLMAVILLVTVYPMVWMVLGSLKGGSEFFGNVWGLPADPVWSNFPDAWREAGLGRKFTNSIVVTAASMAIVLTVTSMAAYALSRLQFRGRRPVYYLLLMGIMVPFGVIAIPVFSVVVELGLLNTLPGLILVYAAQGVPLGTFLMYSFFASIPEELEDAALIDGCRPFGAFVRVILPLTIPGLITQLIFTGTTVWNEYFMASILIHREALQTLPLGLVVFTSKFGIDYPQLFAALTIVTVPLVVLFLSAQRQFIAGMAAGAVKG